MLSYDGVGGGPGRGLGDVAGERERRVRVEASEVAAGEVVGEPEAEVVLGALDGRAVGVEEASVAEEAGDVAGAVGVEGAAADRRRGVARGRARGEARELIEGLGAGGDAVDAEDRLDVEAEAVLVDAAGVPGAPASSTVPSRI